MRVLALMLFAAAIGMPQVRIYVANSGGSSVSVVDPQSNKIVGEIVVSPNPSQLAASPEGHWLYVINEKKNLLEALDLKTSKRTREAVTDRNPSDLAVAPDTRHVFVCTAQSLDVIDTASLEKVRSIYDVTAPCRIYLTPDGTRTIVATARDSMLHVVNIRTMEPEFSISAGSAVYALAIEGDKNHVIHRLFASTHGGVEIIDYASRKVSGHLGIMPRDLAISPDWRTLWASTGDSVEVFSLSNLQKVATIPLGKGASGIVFTPDGKHCFVANTEENSVSSIDPSTYRELARIPVGKGPINMVASEWMP